MKKIRNKKTNNNANLVPHVAIALITCLISVIIIQWDTGLFKAGFREGDIALRDIYAPYDFEVKGDINNKVTELNRQMAKDAVLPVFRLDTEAQQAVTDKAESLVKSAKSLVESPELENEDKKSEIREIATTYNLSESLVSRILESKDHDIFLAQIREIIGSFMSKGMISTLDHERFKDKDVMMMTLVDGDEAENKKFIEDFLTLEGSKAEIEDFDFSIRDRKEKALVVDFANAILNVNIVYDGEETELRKRSAAQQVQPIYNIIEVKKNETILSKGERIGKDHILKLNGIEQNEPSVVIAGRFFAITMLLGLFILIIALYIKYYEPKFSAGNKELVLLGLICVLLLFAAKIIMISPWPSNLVPVAVASMLIAILIDHRLAIIVTCFLSILVGMISGNRLDIAGVSLVGGIVGIFAMRGVRRRSQVMAAGLSVGFANMSYLIAIGIVGSLDFNTYITESFLGFLNGILSALIVTGLLPVFENTFKITTDISLLELADLNHPLLKEMVIKAPGTYHHSLVVGNLAEAACEAIGANPLLARVSSYFHDVGKIEKASYFSENQSSEDSAHDKLSPTMSSLIITNHVKNGVELARQYKLNKKIVDIIKQHHGSGLVFYFFKRALEKVSDETVGEQSFRYPGPKPQTKEAACVLLADSVEAGSRALDDPTPSRIKGLVRKIINNKFIDGQLDECDLTLKDLEKISEIFIHILTGIFHTRVEYPDEPEKRTL